MSINQERYLVWNDTRKQPKVDPKTGKDLRTTVEKNGHAVNIRDESDRVVTLYPGTSPQIVGKLNEGMIRLYEEGLLGVKKVESFSEILALREKAGARTKPRGRAKAEASSPMFKEYEAPQPAGKRVARAVQIGTDADRQREIAANAEAYPEAGAINPSGEPNFVVTAPSETTRRRRAERSARGA